MIRTIRTGLGLIVFGLACVPVAVAPGAAQAPAPKLAAAIVDVNRLFETYMAERHVPGAAWGVIVDGQLVSAVASGMRDVESNARVTSDSVFRIASMTKSFKAISILKLRYEGKL